MLPLVQPTRLNGLHLAAQNCFGFSQTSSSDLTPCRGLCDHADYVTVPFYCFKSQGFERRRVIAAANTQRRQHMETTQGVDIHNVRGFAGTHYPSLHVVHGSPSLVARICPWQRTQPASHRLVVVFELKPLFAWLYVETNSKTHPFWGVQMLKRHTQLDPLSESAWHN